MRKLVSIFLLVLYATTVSASVVTVRYCPAMNEEVAITALQGQDCCCQSGGHMDMSRTHKTRTDKNIRIANTTVSAKQADSADAADTEAVYQHTSSSKATPSQSCCSEVVLQSKVSTRQIISPQSNKAPIQTPQLGPMAGFAFGLTLADVRKLHQPLATSIKPPPAATPLYKLFQRFTYYG